MFRYDVIMAYGVPCFLDVCWRLNGKLYSGSIGCVTVFCKALEGRISVDRVLGMLSDSLLAKLVVLSTILMFRLPEHSYKDCTSDTDEVISLWRMLHDSKGY
jgi:hypothetical protein